MDDKVKYIERGGKCSLWGTDVNDMTRDELVRFIGFLDELATNRLTALVSVRSKIKIRDQDKLVALLTDFGVGFDESPDDEIICSEGDQKIGGYSCFFTTFDFDETGKFVGMGAYE